MLWRLSPKIDLKRSFILRLNKTEASNSDKIRDPLSKATTIAATSNNGDRTIQATTPTGTTKRAASAGDRGTVKRNAGKG
jgi:hypothetical protein